MPTPAWRRWATVIAASFVVMIAAPASAHTDLVSSDPKDGQTLNAAPSSVRLTFGEDLLSAGDRLVAQDAQGVAVDLGASTVKGAVLQADWPTTADAGQYTVFYRAVASDGHPLEGRITFTIKGSAQAPSPASAPSQAPVVPPESTSSVRIVAPVVLLAALLLGGLFVWRSRAD